MSVRNRTLDDGPGLIAIDIGGGLVVWHTSEEWARFVRGVDGEVCEGMAAPLETEAHDG